MQTNDLVQLVKADASLETPNERAVFGNEAVIQLQDNDIGELMEGVFGNLRIAYLMMYALTKRGADIDAIMDTAMSMDTGPQD